MNSEECEFDVRQETRLVRLVRALTWSSILAAAMAFWTTLGWALLAYWRPGR